MLPFGLERVSLNKKKQNIFKKETKADNRGAPRSKIDSSRGQILVTGRVSKAHQGSDLFRRSLCRPKRTKQQKTFLREEICLNFSRLGYKKWQTYKAEKVLERACWKEAHKRGMFWAKIENTVHAKYATEWTHQDRTSKSTQSSSDLCKGELQNGGGKKKLCSVFLIVAQTACPLYA